MRPIKQEEIEIIKALSKGQHEIPKAVLDMNDGGMGSISFDIEQKQSRYDQVADSEYMDSDGVLVLIELSIDHNGNLYELDFWKVDFSPLILYPTIDKLKQK